MATLEDVLVPLIEKNLFKAIELTLSEDTKLSCIALLCLCTESLGSLYSIKRVTKKNGIFRYDRPEGGRKTFEKCLEYMGTDYCKVYDAMDRYRNKKNKKSRNLYDIMRNGTIHQFEPKISYNIVINPKEMPQIIGVEHTHDLLLKINLREYFRDLKKGYEKWKDEVKGDNTGEKFAGVMYTSGYNFPPQGGISKIETKDGQYILKSSRS